jgi:DNA-binding Xre family transcriptional regulator
MPKKTTEPKEDSSALAPPKAARHINAITKTEKRKYKVTSHIQELAKTRGIENAFQLWGRIDGSKETAAQLWRGDFAKIGINTLEKLCAVFDCDVGDLLSIEMSGTPSRNK